MLKSSTLARVVVNGDAIVPVFPDSPVQVDDIFENGEVGIGGDGGQVEFGGVALDKRLHERAVRQLQHAADGPHKGKHKELPEGLGRQYRLILGCCFVICKFFYL